MMTRSDTTRSGRFRNLRAGLIVLAGASILGGCASQGARASNEPPPPPRVASWDQFESDSDLDRVFLGPQPSVEALAAFREQGGSIVVNLRTESEMERMPYYAAAVEGEGLEYVHVPTRGSEMGRTQYEQLRAVLDRSEGPVLVHCGSGTRATYLWGAHLMQADGLSADEAKAWCSTRREGKVWESGDLAIDRIAAGE